MDLARHTTDDGCQIAFTIDGPADAPALVLSNSLGTDHTLWDRQIDAFAKHFRVIRYDTRGHGESDPIDGDYTIDRLGIDLVSLLDGLNIERAHVCGISIGGMTALWLGVHAADRVDRLVLANTCARIGSVPLWNERIAEAKTKGLDGLAESAMGRWFTPAFRAANPAVVARVRDTMRHTPVEGYAGGGAALRDADLRSAASRVLAPTLVITGQHDTGTPPSEGAWLSENIPGATLVELDAAHISNIERAPEFNNAVLQFLR
jgi:3-oxoadipate enol-lactonase